MADKGKDQSHAQSVAGKGGQGAVPDPQNMNQSPSPGGDGVQSSASERAAANIQTNQPAQQRINAAERREKGENPEEGGERSSLIHAPGQVLPYEDEMAAAAETVRKNEKDREKDPLDRDDLPEATRREIEAGRAALDRGPGRRGDRAADDAAKRSE